MSADKLCVGTVSGAYGVRGELRIKSFCAQPEDIETYSPLTSETGDAAYHLALIRPTKNGFVARISEVATKEQADALKGVKLYAQRDQLPSLPDDEYYHADLIGLQVLDTGGTPLGTVKTVLDHGAGDLLEIQRPESSETVLLPFTMAAVPTVDMASGRIIADPPDGLF
ncbi:ribosome maturation factor RimM [Roseobacter sp.]|uniref:ribosome maturation factor RimM n=1 Tax=Roseobacter sp. TaxID=1907202 RepID=UPI003296CE2D